MRGSDPDASIYYLAAMLEGGEDPRFIARRMVILASEDIGNADPQRSSWRPPPRRGRPGRAAGMRAQPRPGRGLPGPGPEVERRDRGDLASRARTIREHGAKLPPDHLRDAHYPGAKSSGAARATGTPTTSPAAVADQPCCRPRFRASASTSPPNAGSRPSFASGSIGPGRGAATELQRPPPVVGERLGPLATEGRRRPQPTCTRRAVHRIGRRGDARLLQPGHRRAGRLGARRSPRTRSRASSTTSPRCSRSGRSSRWPTGPATCAAPPTCSSPTSSEVAEPAHPRAGQADHRELHDGADPDDRRAALVRRRRARRSSPTRRSATRRPFLQDQAQLLHLRAARRRRRDRALELPLVDPVRRGRDRADGRQRRRAQAGQPDAAARRAHPAGLRRRPAFPRASSARSTAAARSARRSCEAIDGEDLLHRLGRGRPQGRRDLRAADEGLGARARRQGPADRLRRRRPRERGLGLRLGRLRERRPDLLGDRAHLRGRGGRRRSSSRACGARPSG